MIRMLLSEAAAALDARTVGQDVVFRGVATDSHRVSPGALFVAVRGARFDGHDFVGHAMQQGAAAALVERDPQVSLPLIHTDDCVRALGELAAVWRNRFRDLVLVAITGSNGKTTVKEMVAAIFRSTGPVAATRGNFNNEIGVPLTLCDLDPGHRLAVVELGANHGGEIAMLTDLVQPSIGVITQCALAHIEGFGGIDGVARAKGELFERMPDDATAIVNIDDPYAALWRELAGRRRCLSFGASADADVRVHAVPDAGGNHIALDTPQGGLEVDLALPGMHNALNAGAAAAVAIAAGVDLDAVRDGLTEMRPVKRRLESRCSPRGTEIIDDTYNANPASLQAGLRVLGTKSAPRWLVLGDMAELGCEGADLHAAAGRDARRRGVERLFVIGELSLQAARAFGDGATHFKDCAVLIERLRDELPAAATVLIKGSRAMAMERVVEAIVEEDR